MNANLPPLQVKVNNAYLDDSLGFTDGTLVSVRAMQNQAFQFSVLLSTGALYTGLPISAFGKLPLDIAQAYDCIGSEIQVITLDLLRYMKCTVKDFNGNIHNGYYLFTIDFTDNNGLARHPEQWKQFHVVKTVNGFMAYPQYRIVFQDDAFCPDRDTLQGYKYNTTIHCAELS